MVRGHDNIVKQFKETTAIMREINYKTEKIRESAYGTVLLLGSMYFNKNDEELKKIVRDFMNKVDFVRDYGEEQYNDGKNEGISTGHIEMIKNLLNDNEITLETAIRRLTMLNCKLEKISEITGLSITEIKAIQNQ